MVGVPESDLLTTQSFDDDISVVCTLIGCDRDPFPKLRFPGSETQPLPPTGTIEGRVFDSISPALNREPHRPRLLSIDLITRTFPRTAQPTRVISLSLCANGGGGAAHEQEDRDNLEHHGFLFNLTAKHALADEIKVF